MQTHRRRPASTSATVLSVLDEHEIAALTADPDPDGPVVCLWPDGADVPDRVRASLHEVADRRPVVVLRHGDLRDVLVDCRGDSHDLPRLDVAASVRNVLSREGLDRPGLVEHRLDATPALQGGDR